jgi:hypothetical protein
MWGGIGAFVAEKYAIQRLQAEAAARNSNAQAGLTSAQTREVAANAEAMRRQSGSTTGLNEAQTDKTRTETGLLPDESRARVGLNDASAANLNASARGQGIQNDAFSTMFNPQQMTSFGMRTPTPPPTGSDGLGFGLGAVSLTPTISGRSSVRQDPVGSNLIEDAKRLQRAPGYAKGTARVPGKGDPRKDTVPAKLAPGEAVLNKPAAETLGRGLITALNKIGAQRMGMV